MSHTPTIFLECPSCKALVDFSEQREDDEHIFCGNCAHDFGPYRKVIEGAKKAMLQNDFMEEAIKSTKH